MHHEILLVGAGWKERRGEYHWSDSVVCFLGDGAGMRDGSCGVDHSW